MDCACVSTGPYTAAGGAGIMMACECAVAARQAGKAGLREASVSGWPGVAAGLLTDRLHTWWGVQEPWSRRETQGPGEQLGHTGQSAPHASLSLHLTLRRTQATCGEPVHLPTPKCSHFINQESYSKL